MPADIHGVFKQKRKAEAIFCARRGAILTELFWLGFKGTPKGQNRFCLGAILLLTPTCTWVCPLLEGT